MAERSEDNASKIIHAAKKGLTAEVLQLLRRDEMICVAASDKVNQVFDSATTFHVASAQIYYCTYIHELYVTVVAVSFGNNGRGYTPPPFHNF